MADKDTEAAEDQPKGKGKTMIIAGAVGLVVVVAAAFLVTNVLLPAPTEGEVMEGEEGEGKDASTKAIPPETSWEREKFSIDNLLVNLAGTGGRRYLKLNLTVEYAAPDLVQAALDVEENTVKLKDCLITLLSGKTLDDVDGSDNKNMLKLEMIERFAEILFKENPGKIEWIYYDQFLTQ